MLIMIFIQGCFVVKTVDKINEGYLFKESFMWSIFEIKFKYD